MTRRIDQPADCCLIRLSFMARGSTGKQQLQYKDLLRPFDHHVRYSPDSRIAYADRPETMGSGFGFSVPVHDHINHQLRSSEKLVGAQMVWVRYPESTLMGR
jgi:hypothetical protein